jgi:hypothetical protein
MERYTNFSEIAAEEPDGVEGGCVTFARYEDRPPENRSALTRKDFPATVKKSAEMDSKGRVGLSLAHEGLLLLTRLKHLARLTGMNSTGDVRVYTRPKDSLLCPSLRGLYTSVAVV